VDAPVFSPDGGRVAYQARDGDEWFVVVDGVPEQTVRRNRLIEAGLPIAYYRSMIVRSN
jgi:hypothetical protein